MTNTLIYNRLDQYWLWKEISRKLGLSNPAYKYWPRVKDYKLNNKYVFLEKKTLPARYNYIEEELTNLSGYLPTSYAADALYAGRIFTNQHMKLHGFFEYKYIENIKFVNIKRFFREYGIHVNKESILHLGKLKDLEISSNMSLYRIIDDYAVAVYN
jgi:hypothetical protein